MTLTANGVSAKPQGGINAKTNNVSNVTNCDINGKLAKSDIQEFYNGKTVLVTGATGFLGKLLIEKLLRSCPGVERVYILVRGKSGKSVQCRVEELINCPVFDILKRDTPHYRKKLVAVSGDLSAPGLAISQQDRQLLAEKVNIIIHLAATVHFTKPLPTALTLNVQAPLELLQLAKNMPQLEVFMHTSTAYSNCNQSLIEEKIYPHQVDLEKLHQMIDTMPKEEVDKLHITLGDWPNTYTFTKALAERELEKRKENIPVGIFRPAIVMSTAQEPFPSWIDNVNGPVGVIASSVSGLIRVSYCDGKQKADLVPADYVVNALIAATRQTRLHYDKTPSEAPPIYNFVTSVKNPVTFQEYLNNIQKPFYYPLFLVRNDLLFTVLTWLLHIIPAYIMDGISICLGRKTGMVKTYSKVSTMFKEYKYFSLRSFNFCDKNTEQLWEKTSENDKKIFPFSMAEIVWAEYFQTYLDGVRRYILKEPTTKVSNNTHKRSLDKQILSWIAKPFSFLR